MAEKGCITITEQHVIDGTITVTPTPSPASGSARVEWKRQELATEKAYSSPRVVVVSGADLVVTLDPSDRAGRQLCWDSYA